MIRLTKGMTVLVYDNDPQGAKLAKYLGVQGKMVTITSIADDHVEYEYEHETGGRQKCKSPISAIWAKVSGEPELSDLEVWLLRQIAGCRSLPAWITRLCSVTSLAAWDHLAELGFIMGVTNVMITDAGRDWLWERDRQHPAQASANLVEVIGPNSKVSKGVLAGYDQAAQDIADRLTKEVAQQVQPEYDWRRCPKCDRLGGSLRSVSHPQIVECVVCGASWTIVAHVGEDT